MAWIYMFVAIIFEVAGTTLLKVSEGFTKWGFGSLSLLSYFICFYFLALALKFIPVGVAYAIWSGVGTVIIVLIGIFLFGQRLNFLSFLGIAMIVSGVILLNLFSGSGESA